MTSPRRGALHLDLSSAPMGTPSGGASAATPSRRRGSVNLGTPSRRDAEQVSGHPHARSRSRARGVFSIPRAIGKTAAALRTRSYYNIEVVCYYPPL